MEKLHLFELSTPAKRLGALGLIPLLFTSPVASARLIDNDEVTINGSRPADDYQVINAGKLTATGAKTHEISVKSQSELVLTGSTVEAQGVANGVTVTGSRATITGSSISSAGSGFLLGSSGVTPGFAQVISSSITGAIAGAAVGSSSRLELTSSNVAGINADGIGLQIANGQVIASDSRITGGGNGVLVVPEGDAQEGYIEFNDKTIVEGINGAAILVEDFGLPNSPVNIQVNSGSSLIGGNGVLLQVNGTYIANMTVNNSQLEGDVVAESGATAHLTLENAASLTGQLTNVSSLAVNSGARWNMVADGNVAALSMTGGSVNFDSTPGAFRTLTLGTLSGTGGTFDMKVDLAAQKGDLLNVTGTATGNHLLAIANTGVDAVNGDPLKVVTTGGGDAQFGVVGNAVDVGTYKYLLEQSGNDWQLVGTNTITPSTASVLGLFNAAPTVWYGELAGLRTRFGDLRLGKAAAGGVWARTYGGKYKVAGDNGAGYQQQQFGLSAGADTAINVADGRALVGVVGGFSKSDLDFNLGTSGKIESYYAGIYGTWLSDSGYYLDGVLKANHLRNEADVRMSDGVNTKGKYNNLALGASVEFGRHIALEQGWFVEPFAQLAAVWVDGKNYALDNDLQANNDSTSSLQARLGTSFGRNLTLANGGVVQPFVKAALVQDFSGANAVRVNDNRFDNDLTGTRAEIGAGIAAQLNEQTQLHANVDYGIGNKVDQPWGFNVGVRYSW